MKLLKVIPLILMLIMSTGCSMTPEEWQALNATLNSTSNSINNYYTQQAQQLRSFRAPRITPLQPPFPSRIPQWQPIYLY